MHERTAGRTRPAVGAFSEDRACLHYDEELIRRPSANGRLVGQGETQGEDRRHMETERDEAEGS